MSVIFIGNISCYVILTCSLFFTALIRGIKGMEISKLNGKPYHLNDVARVEDPKQQKLFIKHDVYPIDMYTTTDVIIDEITGEETLRDKLIMVFSRKESKDLYILWKRRELK